MEKPLSFVFSPKIGTLQLFFSFVFLVPSSKDPTWWSRSRGGRGFALGRAAPGLGSFQTATAGPVVVRRRRRGDDHTFSVDLVRPIVHSLLTRVGTGQRRPGPGSAIALFSRTTNEDRERCRRRRARAGPKGSVKWVGMIEFLRNFNDGRYTLPCS